MTFFIKLEQIIQTFIQNYKRCRIAKAIFRENKAGGMTLSDFRQYYKATVIKIVQYWYKEKYCIGTRKVRLNQGKLEVIKQEMARVNVDILRISETKWTRMGEFNSDDHYIYYCEQESLKEMEQLSQSTKESKIQYLDAVSKMTE